MKNRTKEWNEGFLEGLKFAERKVSNIWARWEKNPEQDEDLEMIFLGIEECHKSIYAEINMLESDT